MKRMLIMFWCLIRKSLGFCTHPTHDGIAVLVKGVEYRRCRKCYRAIHKHGKYWIS